MHASTTTSGKLRFRGGLELKSPDDAFGGVSGLLVSRDGASFVAISDEAHWITGTLGYEGERLASATGGLIAPLLDRAGLALDDKSGDAEGLASTNGDDTTGDLFVSFEGNHRLWRYPFAEAGVRSIPRDVPLPPETRLAPRNGGLEGIATLDDRWLVALTERHRDRAGDYHGWLIRYATRPGDDAPESRPLALKAVPPFAVTDVRRLPDGDLLTLERRYAAATGVGMQMRRIPKEAIEAAMTGEPAAPLDGEVVANLDADWRIDNMEGLAVRIGERGETLLYVVSDDNYSPVQSTLLLLFELLP